MVAAPLVRVRRRDAASLVPFRRDGSKLHDAFVTNGLRPHDFPESRCSHGAMRTSIMQYSACWERAFRSHSAPPKSSDGGQARPRDARFANSRRHEHRRTGLQPDAARCPRWFQIIHSLNETLDNRA